MKVMRLPYQDRVVEFDRVWADAAVGMGLTNFCTAEDGFSEILRSGCHSGTLPRRVTGIYFWRAENGEAYVGQAVDVRSRLRQHFKNHRDLQYAAYRPVLAQDLNAEERRVVALAERQFPLRNIKLVHDTASYRPFDGFLTLAEQMLFVNEGNTSAWLAESRRAFPILETRSRSGRAELESRPRIFEALRNFVTLFVKKCIPRPRATENRFWSVTYLGKDRLRLNTGQQEVCTCDLSGEGQEVRLISRGRMKFFSQRTDYETGHFANVFSLKDATALLLHDRRLQGVREAVVHLARHTTPLNLRSHCPWLYAPNLGNTA